VRHLVATIEQLHKIIDIGVNLVHRSFCADQKGVIEPAFAAGVQTMIVTGASLRAVRKR
jgi:TatD DNase family protein